MTKTPTYRRETVYRARKCNADGTQDWPSGYYRKYHEARDASDWNGDPYRQDVIVTDDGLMWPIASGPIEFSADVEAARAAALAKLTPEERKLLGIKETP